MFQINSMICNKIKPVHRSNRQYRFFQWLQPESNWRHKDFQSFALPTELQSQMVARAGFEPTASGLWARRATRLLYLAMWRSFLNII